MDILLYKSARYTVERPLQIGAALAGAEPADAAVLSCYGTPIGEAFQLRDDVLGVFGDPAVTGKSALIDMRDGKSTLLIALTRERADRPQAAAIDRWYGNPDLTGTDAERLREIIVATGALSAVERMIATRTENAVAALRSTAVADDVRSALEDMARTLSGRRS
jgi:geranylgeranyl diphosphate synthase type I